MAAQTLSMTLLQYMKLRLPLGEVAPYLLHYERVRRRVPKPLFLTHPHTLKQTSLSHLHFFFSTMGFLSKDQIASVKEDIKGDDRFFRLNMLDDNSTGYRVRFLGQAITGWEIWVTDDEDNDIKLRFEEKPDELPENAKADMSGKKEYKRFVASLIYDYQLEKLRVLDIAQPGVLGKIFAMDDDADYGDPTGYDIKFSKTVIKKKTSYDALAAPPKAVAPSIAKLHKDTYCNLQALFDNEDPWVEEGAAAK